MNILCFLLLPFMYAAPALEAVPCAIGNLAHSGKTRHRVNFLLDREPRSSDLLKEQLRLQRQSQDSPELNLNLGVTFLSLADSTRWNYLDQAIVYLSKARSAQPEDPLVLMYLGRTMGARALNVEPSSWTRLSWAREGFKFMDKALAMDSQCFFLRLLRGESQLLAHPILRRGSRLDEDAAFMEAFTTQAPYMTLPDYQKARIQLFLGNYKDKRKKDPKITRAHWLSVVDLASSSPFATEALARMKGNFQSLGYDGEEEG